MVVLKNLTNAPYDIPLADGIGSVRLGPLGEVSRDDLHPRFVAAVRAAPGRFEITDVEDDTSREQLITLAESLGVKVDKRWGADRLTKEIEAFAGGGQQ